MRLLSVGWMLAFGALAMACNRHGFDAQPTELTVEPMFLRFSARAGETVTAVPVSFHGQNSNPFSWSLAARAPWIHLSKKQGSGSATIWVSVETSGLEPKTYHSTIRIILDEPGGLVETVVGVELTLEAPGWTALATPFGGQFYALAVHPLDSNRVLAGAHGDVYVSSDGGQSFISSGSSLPADRVVALALSEGETAYLATANAGVFRSDDSGISWAPTMLQSLNLYGLALDASRPELVLARGDELWRTTDGGASWAQVPLGATPTCVTLDAQVPGVFVVGDDEGNLHRGDGTSFVTVATDAGRDILSFVSLPGGRWLISDYPVGTYAGPAVRLSDDQGGTWTNIMDRLDWPGIYGNQPYLVAGYGAVWATSPVGAGVSTNNGESFAQIPLPTDRSSSSASQTGPALPHPSGTLVASAGDGILRYSTAAESPGFSRVQVFAYSVVDFDYHQAAGQLVLITSTSQIFSYDAVSGAIGRSGSGSRYSFNTIRIDPRNPFVMHASFWLYVSTGMGTGVQRTEDGGESWQIVLDRYTGSFDRAPDNPDVLWASTGSPETLQRSTDNGDTWNTVLSDSVGDVVAVSATHVLATVNGLVSLVSSAGAITATFTSGRALARTLDGSLWYVGTTLYRSTDASGTAFTSLPLVVNPVHAVAVHPDHPSRIFVGTDEGMVVSEDGGQTWSDAGAPFRVTALVMTPEELLYVGTSGGGLYTYRAE